MKLQRQERAAMKDRINWLKGWLKERHYDIKDERNDFLYVYYSTVRMIYGPRLSRDLLHPINGQFKKPLPESSIDTIISNVEIKHVPSRYRNQDIVCKLGITQNEVEKLHIGHNQKEILERERRKEIKKQRNEDIELLYGMDYTIDEIATEHPEISKRTIQRHIAKFRKQTQTEHEKDVITAEVMRLYREEYSLTGIARRTGITVEEVRRILNLDSMTNFTIQETIRKTSESPQFKTSECQELFIVPFTKYNEAIGCCEK